MLTDLQQYVSSIFLNCRGFSVNCCRLCNLALRYWICNCEFWPRSGKGCEPLPASLNIHDGGTHEANNDTD